MRPLWKHSWPPLEWPAQLVACLFPALLPPYARLTCTAPLAPAQTPAAPASCRCGNLPFVFDPGFGFEQYVDYVLDVPMYFVYRDGTYHDVSGQSFKDFMKGRLPGLPGAASAMGCAGWVTGCW